MQQNSITTLATCSLIYANLQTLPYHITIQITIM